MRALPPFGLTVLTVLISAAALPALAGDIDLVYGDDIARRGELATELAARWSQTGRESDLAGRILWQAVGELAYGVSDHVSVGIKLPVSRFDGSWRADGAYAEVKYLAPRRTDGLYWGAEIEAGSIKEIGEERAFVVEAFPILGYRTGRFHLAANPGIDYSSEGEEKGWAFSPKVKIAYQLNDLHALGLEYHVDGAQHRRTAYLTWDANIAGQRLSVALGHGTTRASDRWALRIGIELDD
jgi:hypothetical protein